jgi:hypothetical protein
MEYIRICPDCGKELKTKNKYYYRTAILENKKCGSCSLTGRTFTDEHRQNLSKNHANITGSNNPFFGKSHTFQTKTRISESKLKQYRENPETIKLLSEARKRYHLTNENAFKGKTHTDYVKKILSIKAKDRFSNEKQRKMISDALIGNTPWNKGKRGVYSDDTIKKMSNSAKKRIMEYGNNQIHSYNPKSIPIIEEFGNKHGYNFRHAENGGEFQIPNTSFFVDGYDTINNVVIEYDEKYHFKETQQIKDKERQDMIGTILKCKFIRIDENNNIIEFNYEN